MKKYILMVLMALIVVFVASCEGTGSEKANGMDYLVTIKTEMGEMKAILYDETPQHKENFIKLAKKGFFDSLLFHRVMSGFMIQGGDPDSRNAEPGERLGSGNPGYTIPAEFVKSLFHQKGALSAARQSDVVNPAKESNGSQFFIVQGRVFTEEETGIDMQALSQAISSLRRSDPNNPLNKVLEDAFNEGGDETFRVKAVELADKLTEATGLRIKMPAERVGTYTTVGGYPPLDENYTVFGQVISGLDVIDKIAFVNTDQSDRPLEDVHMVITVEEMSREEIVKKYGPVYQ
ncbi:peptidylprolyl isomerase [Roseivirga echinicomitans]